MNELLIERPQLNYWTLADDAELRRLWPDNSASVLGALLGRTRNAVISRARRLDLPDKTQPNLWTEAQVAELKRLWPDMTIPARKIAEMIGGGKTAHSVIQRAKRDGLANRPRGSGWWRPRKANGASQPERPEGDQAARNQVSKSLKPGKPLGRPLKPMVPHPAYLLPLAPIPSPKPSTPRLRGVGDARLGTACTIIEIGPAGCRWPVSQNDDGIHIFCGRHRTEKSSYCPDHLAIRSGPTQQLGYGSVKFRAPL